MQVQDTDSRIHSIDAPLGVSSSMHVSSGMISNIPVAEPPDHQGPILLTSASPQRPLNPKAVKCHAAAAASGSARSSVLLSGTGEGTLTVVRTQFVPLADSLSDSDSDSEVRLACCRDCTIYFCQHVLVYRPSVNCLALL